MNAQLNVQKIANGYLLSGSHNSNIIGHSLPEEPRFFSTLDEVKDALEAVLDAQLDRADEAEQAMKQEQAHREQMRGLVQVSNYQDYSNAANSRIHGL